MRFFALENTVNSSLLLTFILTWHHGLALVPTAEARDSARDEDHEADRNATNNQQQFQVDLAIATGVPKRKSIYNQCIYVH